MALGIVRSFVKGEGWGAIMSDELPRGQDAWVHFSAISGTGYRELFAGEHVEFDYERAQQDGFSFRATGVRRLEPGGDENRRPSA